MADDLDPMETREWLDSLDSVGDADPFRSQAAELASVLRRHGLRLTTLFWNGTGDHLNHEYQFDFDLPQARTAFERTLASGGQELSAAEVAEMTGMSRGTAQRYLSHLHEIGRVQIRLRYGSGGRP